jgi:hypothetical protein
MVHAPFKAVRHPAAKHPTVKSRPSTKASSPVRVKAISETAYSVPMKKSHAPVKHRAVKAKRHAAAKRSSGRAAAHATKYHSSQAVHP